MPAGFAAGGQVVQAGVVGALLQLANGVVNFFIGSPINDDEGTGANEQLFEFFKWPIASSGLRVNAK